MDLLPTSAGTFIVLLCLPIVSRGASTCLSCNAAVVPKDCETIERCGPSEDCFADVYATALGYPRFDLGCRDTQQCIGGGRKRYSSTDKLLQSFCCSDNLCNQAAGTVTGYKDPRGPVCFDCSEQGHYDSCNRIRVCGVHEKCVIRSKLDHAGMFQTGCERDTVCNVGSIIGKRDGNLRVTRDNTCGECCDTDLCNDKCSHQNVTLNPCAPKPCINGRCFAKADNYVCECYPGYSGSHCENKDLADQCLSNPCAYGTCHNYGSYYACSCQLGYTGVNCDRFSVADHCTPNPCIHGNCSNSAQGFRCTCTLGYSGVTCEKFTPVDHCGFHPCGKHGTCLSTATNFLCTCSAGYTGGLCDTVVTVDPCLSNPCFNGHCVSSSDNSKYSCTCNLGYTGNTCETQVSLDPCNPDPCMHGTCLVGNDTATPFVCDCDILKTGKLCDQDCPELQHCNPGVLCLYFDENWCRKCRPDCLI